MNHISYEAILKKGLLVLIRLAFLVGIVGIIILGLQVIFTNFAGHGFSVNGEFVIK